jgi:hypothetical protein
MKRLVIALGIVTVVVASGVAAATVLSAGSSPTPTGEKAQGRQVHEKGSNEPGEAGIHGGMIQRFHKPVGCDLVDISSLQGNWTHGDYVAAVAALGDASVIPVAAHSDCGKPMVSVGHGHGPPDFVQQKLKGHKTGGEEPEKPPGS